MSYREKRDSDGQLELFCRSCSFTRDSHITGVILSSEVETNTKLAPNPELQYDTTPNMTKHTVTEYGSCANKDCESNDIELWGKLRADGIVIQPDVAVTNYFTTDRTLTNICHICGTMWSRGNIKTSI
jgi:hypothetical protein